MPDSPGGTVWVEVAHLTDLVPGEGREITHAGRAFALFRLGDEVAALGGLCPHQRSHLARGRVDPDQGTVTCPRRGCLRWRFSLRTGAHAADLPVICPTYPVEVRAGVVVVALPE